MSRRLLPLSITILLFIGMAAFGAIRYDGFLSPQVFLNLLIDNAFLLVVAVGMTFVILSGGIDLSVGSVIALTTMISATLLEAGWNPYAAMALVLLLGSALRRAAGISHPALRARALHRHAGRHVPGARLLLPHQHRIHSRSMIATYAAIAQARIPVGFDASLTVGALIAHRRRVDRHAHRALHRVRPHGVRHRRR